MKYYQVRKQWSQTDEETVVVVAQSADEITKFYKAMGDRGPRYVSVYEVADILFLENGRMKSMEEV